MKNKKGFTLIEVFVSCTIITIIVLNASTFFLFAWKLKVRFEEDRAVLAILTSYIEAKRAACIGTSIKRKENGDGIYGVFQFKANKGEFEDWKKYSIDIWDFSLKEEKKEPYPPLIYPLPSTKKFNDDGKADDKNIQIQYQLCKIEIDRSNGAGSKEPKFFLMPSMYVWCKPPNSNNKIGMQVTNAFPWRNYNNGQYDNF